MEKKLYYAETGLGCCIREAKNIGEAEDEILREVGTRAGVSLVREATQEDIDYVKGWGGYVPT